MAPAEAIRIASLWRGGAMIGWDEADVRDTLLAEVERLNALNLELSRANAEECSRLQRRLSAIETAARLVSQKRRCRVGGGSNITDKAALDALDAALQVPQETEAPDCPTCAGFVWTDGKVLHSPKCPTMLLEQQK